MSASQNRWTLHVIGCTHSDLAKAFRGSPWGESWGDYVVWDRDEDLASVAIPIESLDSLRVALNCVVGVKARAKYLEQAN